MDDVGIYKDQNTKIYHLHTKMVPLIALFLVFLYKNYSYSLMLPVKFHQFRSHLP